MRVLRESHLKRVLNAPTGLDIIERTFREHGAGKVQRLSEPALMRGGSGLDGAARFRVKGATLISERVTGFRVIGDAPEADRNRPYHLLCVCDDRTGAPIGLLDETWLHRFRTALTAVAAAKYLARRASRIAALIGAGAIARELFPALTDTFDLKEIRVVARRLENARRFCREFDGRIEAEFLAVEEVSGAIDGADIVITLTIAERPLVLPGMLAPGSFLCSMGETEEVAIGVLDEMDGFFVDDFDYAAERGDIALWLEKGSATRGELLRRVDATMGEVVAGKHPGRRRSDQRMFAIIQGMAICDLALAHHALIEAAARGIGEELNLFDRTPIP